MADSDELFADADINNDGSISKAEFRDFINRNSVVSNSGGFLLNNYTNVTETDQYESSAAFESAAEGSYNYSRTSSANITQQYETDAQGLFKDNNPQIIRKPATEGPLTYQQNIRVRFLQPPAVPPPGPLIIKEVRPPQPPAPEPLVVRQRAPTPPQAPPLVLRERPPVAPAVVASQTVIKNLPPIPVPPRSVIIEKTPAPPAKPRDIVIERWIPYGAAEKRKTIVQRAEAAKEYSRPRNVIIEYEQPQVRVVRQFQRLNVTPEDPQAYIQRYGAALLDAQALLQQARAAGVIEDLSPPSYSSFVSTGRESLSISSSNVVQSNNNRLQFDSVQSRFSAADTNKDGFLSPSEFHDAGFY